MFVYVRKQQPSTRDVHIDRGLTNISVAYIQQLKHFIAGSVFPVVPVDKQTDKYFTFTKADWFRDEAERRGDGMESAGSGYNVSNSSYYCDVWALHKDIGHQVRANTDVPLDPDRAATEFITQRLMLRREKQWTSDYFTTSVWDTDSTPSTTWDDYTGASDPINDVEVGKRTVLESTGFLPNTLVLGYRVFEKLRNHPDMVDRIKYTTAESVTTEILARIFGVERVMVAMAIENTAAEGATASYAFTHGKHALLAYVNPNPGLMQPSAGYIFAWKGVSDMLGETIGISRFYIQEKKCWRVEAEIAFDDIVIGSDLGYFFNGAVA